MAKPLALLDTNLYVNFLMSRDPSGSAVGLTIEAAAQGSCELLLPVDVVAELAAVISQRPHLAGRVNYQQLTSLLRLLRKFATPVPAFADEIPAISRDPHDDYLIALSIVYDVDFLVTRDQDLFALERVGAVRIVDPATFLEWLRSNQP